MDLSAITPIIKETIEKSLSEKRYPFGFSKNTGLGNKVASGKLADSVQVKVEERTDESIISIFMEDYWVFVQNGRLPGKKGVPIKEIEKWIKDRKLLGRDKKGRFIKRTSFAFGIQKNIKKFGIRPSNFIDVAFDKLETDQRIIDIVGKEAFDELVNIIEGI